MLQACQHDVSCNRGSPGALPGSAACPELPVHAHAGAGGSAQGICIGSFSWPSLELKAAKEDAHVQELDKALLQTQLAGGHAHADHHANAGNHLMYIDSTCRLVELSQQ